MAKICPLSGEKVIYLTCQECEHSIDCKDLKKQETENAARSQSKNTK